MSFNLKTSRIERLAGLFFLLAAFFLLFPFAQNLALFLAERFLLHRELQNPAKWISLMRENGVFCALFGIFALVNFSNLKSEKRIFLKDGAEKSRILFLLCAVFAAVVFVFPFLSKDFWYDEAFSLSLVKHNVSDIIRLTNLDVHPPLYYLILKIPQSVFGDSVLISKIVSALPFAAALFLAGFFLRKNFSFVSAVMFCLLFMASEGLVHYSNEIRMYSWAAFFIILCSVFSYKMIFSGKKRFYLLYGIFASLAALTQHFAAVAMIFHILFTFSLLLLIERKNFKKILITCAIGFLIYLPEIPVVLAQFSEVSSDYWIGPLTFGRIAGFGTQLFSCGRNVFTASFFIMILAFFCAVKSFLKIKEERLDFSSDESKKRAFALIQFLTPLFLILFGTVISIAVRPVFVSRYIIPSIPLMLIFISVSAKDFLTSQNLKKIAALLLFCVALNISCSFKEEIEFSMNDKKTLKTLNKKVTPETQFVYPKESHASGVIPVLFPKNQHFLIGSKNLMQEVFYSAGSDFEKTSSSKPKCFVMTEDFFKANADSFDFSSTDTLYLSVDGKFVFGWK